MTPRKEVDWQRELSADEREAERERQRGPLRPEMDPDGWPDVLTNFLGEWDGSSWQPRPVGEGKRLFVVQTCRWREEQDECADWSPDDGRAIKAFARFSMAKRFARRQQIVQGIRLGLVEVEVDRIPVGDLYLLKEDHVVAPEEDEALTGRGRILAAFADRYEAEQAALDRERDRWQATCDLPIYFSLDWTSLPPELIGDLFLDLDLPAPPSAEVGFQAVWEWWKRTAPLMDGWQRERLRLAMDRFSDYRVVAVPFSPSAARR